MDNSISNITQRKVELERIHLDDYSSYQIKAIVLKISIRKSFFYLDCILTSVDVDKYSTI